MVVGEYWYNNTPHTWIIITSFYKKKIKAFLIKTMKYYTIVSIFLFISFQSCNSTKIPKSEVSLEKVVKDTIPTRFEPDPFSSLLEMETQFGTMKIELFFEAGEHRENFIKLAKNKALDATLFHRVIKNFMIQGGDPSTKNAKAGQRIGTNSSGKEIAAEINSRYFHVKGAFAAARQPDEVNPEKKSSGSQFYIVHGNPVSTETLDKNERTYGIVYGKQNRELYRLLGGAPQLDMNYTVFGRVYEGLNVIDSIAVLPTDSYDRPEKDVKITVRVIKE
jgi:peptidyl-prolyl cis-trans isomerase B (cyclophilin B)